MNPGFIDQFSLVNQLASRPLSLPSKYWNTDEVSMLAQRLCGCRGSEFGSSHLHGKCCTYEAISPAPLTIFITRIPLLQEEHDNMDGYYIPSRNWWLGERKSRDYVAYESVLKRDLNTIAAIVTQAKDRPHASMHWASHDIGTALYDRDLQHDCKGFVCTAHPPSRGTQTCTSLCGV